MPISPDLERQILKNYRLTTLYPDASPHNDDDDDDSSDGDDDDDADPTTTNPSSAAKSTHQQSKLSPASRSNSSKYYRNMDRHASLRSSISGTQKHLGVDSLVQSDEPDALGTVTSVTAELRRRGLPVEDNVKLRNRFMLTSTSFSPALYLAHVHQHASTDDLLRGLDVLTTSIEQKSASLKLLVESNFERFVRAKATIDNVYTEMRTHGSSYPTAHGAAQSPATPGVKTHIRHTSRTQGHFRTTSGGMYGPATSGKSPAQSVASDKRKNALTKESEYGVLGIKQPLQELTIKAEEVWGPTLGGREREETVKAALACLDQHREVFALSGTLSEAVNRRDYEGVVTAWKSAQRFASEARQLADASRKGEANGLADASVRQILVTARMWALVSRQMDDFKHDVWRRLKTSHSRKPTAVTDEAEKEEHMELMAVLLQLGVDENPIWEWLNSRCLYLKDRVTRTSERSRAELEILRRHLAHAHYKALEQDSDSAQRLSQSLLTATATLSTSHLPKSSSSTPPKDLDTVPLLNFWDRALHSLTSLLSPHAGLLAEVLDFWSTAQSFISSHAQQAFPAAVLAAPQAQEHLRLEPDDIANLRSGAADLVSLLRQNVHALFVDPPVKDLGELYSPVTPESARRGGSGGGSFAFDPASVPPSPSGRDGKDGWWEKFAFWAPGANCLSGAHFLAKMMMLVGTAAGEMAGLAVMQQQQIQSRTGSGTGAGSAATTTTGGVEGLKTLVNATRERCVQALCASWIADAECVRFLEDWRRQADRGDLTRMPARFLSLEERVLAGVQRVAFVSGAEGAGREAVIVPPPAKLLMVVRQAFVTGLYKALSGMVENAETERVVEGETEEERGVWNGGAVGADGEAWERVDDRDRNVRILLTLSNLAHLRADTIPHLTAHFESLFSVKLTEESKTIRDVLTQIDARLFQSYVSPLITDLTTTISAGIASPTWPPTTPRPVDAKPYVYDILLVLVLVHAQVSSATTPTTTTASSGSLSSTSTPPATLTTQLLSHLLEHASLALLAAFKLRPHYALPALMQATLDVEFLAQTLSQYTTERAGEVQSQVYLALDERTDDEARNRLQGELPEMRKVLKRLREGTRGEFGCFRKERRGRAGVATGGVQGAGEGRGGGRV